MAAPPFSVGRLSSTTRWSEGTSAILACQHDVDAFPPVHDGEVRVHDPGTVNGCDVLLDATREGLVRAGQVEVVVENPPGCARQSREAAFALRTASSDEDCSGVPRFLFRTARTVLNQLGPFEQPPKRRSFRERARCARAPWRECSNSHELVLRVTPAWSQLSGESAEIRPAGQAPGLCESAADACRSVARPCETRRAAPPRHDQLDQHRRDRPLPPSIGPLPLVFGLRLVAAQTS